MALPLSDPFRQKYDDVGGVDWPAISAAAVTPNDGLDLAVTPRGIYVGTAGHLKCDMADVGTVVFNNLAAGMIHAIRPKRIWATGTTALNIVAVW